MKFSEWQRVAIEDVAYLAEECVRPRYRHVTVGGSIVLTVNSGYE